MGIQLKKLLCPTDFSEISRCAIPYALELARQFGAEVHCLNVIDEAAYCWMGAGAGVVPLVVSREELWSAAEHQMTSFVDHYFEPTDVPVVKMVASGRPFVEIIRYAKTNAIDMIVMATHGHGGLAQVLMGSVAEKVVRKSPCPVLTIRHPEHEFVMP